MNRKPDLNDLEGDIGQMATLLDLLVDRLVDSPEYTDTSSVALGQSVSLSIVLRDMAERMRVTMATVHQAWLDERRAPH
ncbi:hypothetical protein [Mesorhizobium sp. NZP2077]|uniref:hypothetical protein n=1 Tax=Mesorhizobium sp. NZP2077 TaxID=2483404 RepID=UPI0015572BE0|nr:hypothetical protein [Mesorhizobium sp. NZP2077]QKC81541.1 hypothetical protein EB232_07670 [Mesorhizobium sp. NZP2077]QKD14990.1 hypothetical protein HGP13_07560 [Mesorhizobium sp. NZP2077]